MSDELHQLSFLDEEGKDRLIRFINDVSSCTDIMDLAVLLTDALPEITAFDYFLLMLYQPDRNKLVGIGPAKRAHLVHKDEGLISLFKDEVEIDMAELKDIRKAIQNKRPIELGDAETADILQRISGKTKKEINYLSRLMRMNTCLIQPITVQAGHPSTETVVGLMLATTPNEHLEKPDRFKLSLVTRQLGVVLNNELNIRRLQWEIESKDSDQKLLEAFNRATLDVQRAFDEESMYHSLSESLRQSGLGFMAMRKDHATGEITVRHLTTSRTMHATIRQALSLDLDEFKVKGTQLPSMDRMFGLTKPVFLDNIQDVIKDMMKALGMVRHIKRFQDLLPVEKCIICPLIVKGHCDNILVISKNDLAPKDMLSAEVFSLHISNALERIRAHKENEEKTRLIRLMHDLSTALNKALSMDRIYDVLRVEVSKVHKFDYVGLLLFEKDPNTAIGNIIIDPSGKEGQAPTAVMFDDKELEELIELKELRVGTEEPSRDGSPEAKAFLRLKLRSWLVLPLRVENRMLGFLALGSQTKGAFDENILNMVSSMKDPLSTAVYNASIIAEEKRRSDQLRIVSEISKFSTSVVSQRTLYREVLRLLSNTFGYKGAHIIRIDPLKRQFQHIHSSDPEEEKRFKGHVQPAEKGVLGKALRERRTIIVPNTKADPEYIDCVGGMLSEIVVPVFYEGEIEVFISVQSPVLNIFDEKDILTLETVSNAISSLMRTLRQKELEEQRLEHLSAVNDLGRELLPLADRDRILTAAANLMEDRLSYRRIRVFLMDPRTKGLVLKAVAGLVPSAPKAKVGQQVPLGTGPVGLAASKGATTLSGATGPKEDQKPSRKGEPVASALLCSPFKVKEEVVGVICVETQEGKTIDEWDKLALESMAREVGKALEMAQAIEETQRRSRLLALVNEISLNLSKDLSKKGVMERFTDDFQKSRKYLDVALFLLDKDRKLLVKQAQSGDYKGRSPPDYCQNIEEGLFSICLQKRETVVVNDVSIDKRFKTRPWVKTRSEMVCPIKVGEDVIGLINVESDKLNAFDDWDRLAVETLSRSLAMTLQNSILFEEEQRRSDLLKVLSELSTKALNASDLDILLQDVVDTLDKRFRFYSTCIFMEDERKWPLSVLKMRATSGAYKDLAAMGTELPSNEGLIGACFQGGKPILCNDTTVDKRFIPEPKKGSMSELCLPITVSGKTVGVLNVESDRKGTFTQWESIALETVADIVSRAIQNLRQVDELIIHSRDISGVMEIEKGLTPELDMDTIIHKAAKLIQKELAFQNVELYYVDVDGYEFELKAHARTVEKKKGPLPGYRHSLDSGLIGQAYKQRSMMLINETMKFDKYYEGLGKNVRSAVAAPVLVGKEIVCMLNIESDEPNEFGEWDRLVITVMSDLLSGALDRAKRYKEQQDREALITMAYDTGNELSRATSVDGLLKKAGELLKDKLHYFHVEISSITTEDPAKPEIVLRTASGGLKRKVSIGSKAPAGNGLVGWCISNREDAFVNDVALDPRCKEEKGGDVKSEMVVLIGVDQTIFGAVEVKSKHFDAFTEKDHTALRAVVRQMENLLWHLRTGSRGSNQT